MENHRPHFHSHRQRQQYEFLMPDLRQLMTTNRPTSHHHFPAAAGIVQPELGAAELFPGHHRSSLTPQEARQQQNFEMLMLPRGLQDFGAAAANCNNGNESTISNTVTAGVSTPGFSNTGFEGEAAGAGAYLGGWEGGNGRWPRQETLTLLEIRSRLDSKFKEANQKGPLWDEISRVMSEEHGYQRSGKKCREKFENLYKYYKKTKEGKAGRHDGKHYRFFRQLEALYGDLHTPNNKTPLNGISSGTTLHFNPSTTSQFHHQELNHSSLSPSNHNSLSESDAMSSATDDVDNELNTVEITYSAERVNKTRKKKKKKKRGSSWKEKIKEFIDSQMRKLVEKQEAWLEKLTRTLEQKEKERVMREEEWKRQDQGRVDREHKFWGKQRAWIEARDAALMETLQTFTGINKHFKAPAAAQAADVDEDDIINGETISKNNTNDRWTDGEITKLIQMRTNMEARFQQCNTDDDDSEELALWEEVASRMIGKGFEKKNALMCKDKWDCIKSCRKLRKENTNNNNGSNYYLRGSSNCGYKQSSGSSFYSQGTANETTASGRQLLQLNHQDNIYSSSSTAAGETSNSNNNASNAVSLSDSCFRFLIADNGDHHLWENYGLKLSNDGSDHYQCSDTLHL